MSEDGSYRRVPLGVPATPAEFGLPMLGEPYWKVSEGVA